MKTFFKNNILGYRYQGIEIFESNGQELFALLVLENRKGELEVISEHLVESFDELLSLLDTKIPLFITLNTSKILKKQLVSNPTDKSEIVLINAFPNLEVENFYYHMVISQSQSVVSIGKKDYIDSYLEQFESAGYQVVKLALGISNIKVLEGAIDGVVDGSNFKAELVDGLFSGFMNISEKRIVHKNIDGIQLNNNSILSFTQILGVLQQNYQPSNLKVRNHELFHEYKNQKWFEFGIRFGLLFFLVVLLLNFLVFNHFYEKNQQLELNIVENKNQNGFLTKFQERIANKESKLERILNSKDSKTSFYLDELGKSVPISINLNAIQYQPLKQPVRTDKAIIVVENNISISGITNDKDQFTSWADWLETQYWVNRVEIIDYEYLSKSSSNFTLNVNLNTND